MWKLLIIILLCQMGFVSADEPKVPKGYLAKVGPAPIRFESARPTEKLLTLKPLVMADPIEPTSELNSITNLPFLDSSFRTNVVENLPAQNIREASISPTVDDGKVASSPTESAAGNSGGNENPVVTPQMFLRFFNTNSGSETVISAPIKPQQPVSTPPSSSATYISR